MCCLYDPRGSVSCASAHFATDYGGVRRMALQDVRGSQVGQLGEGSVQRQQSGGVAGAASSSVVRQEQSRCQS